MILLRHLRVSTLAASFFANPSRSNRLFASLKESDNSLLSKQDRMIRDSVVATKLLGEFYADRPNAPMVGKTCELLDGVDTVLFDCDGVLYQSTDPCPGAADCLRYLIQEKDKKVLFVTNNAGVNRRQLRDKLTRVLNLESNLLTADQMVSSASASAQYLRDRLPKGSKVFVIGSAGLCEELEEAGFIVLGGPEGTCNASMDRDELASYDFATDAPVDAVVVGHDTDFTFRKLSIANNLLLRSPQALFVATNLDSFDLVGSAIENDSCPRHIPGNGCVVKALEHCSQRTAVNVGKPSHVLAEQIRSAYKDIHMSRCLFVGDRLDTDILFARRTGMQSLLVMTGVTTAEQLMQLENDDANSELLPTYILPYIGELVSEHEKGSASHI